jgi:MoaA/NifB/PqqE/SkfB family radical SAM enzyme
MEWHSNSRYNSFNSFKGLAYMEHYKKIIGWLDGKNALPAPIEVSLDPVNECNNICYYCNSQRYLREHPAHLLRWGREYMEELLSSIAVMGAKAFCWGGGGEATLNIRLPEMTDFGIKLGMECSIITNGVYLPDELMDKLLLCRWIGVSIDSAIPEVYEKVRGTDSCLKVLDHISKLVKKRTKTDIAMKVLILPETIDSIVYTCQVAKELGVQDFHVRPVDLERKDFKVAKKLNLDMVKIQTIFEKCHALETPDFHVYTVTHKYDQDFHVKHDFHKCLASPLVMQICTDKKMYVCVDHRMEPRFEIKEWGSDQHRELLKGIDPSTECARCTWSEYKKQIEDCVIEDKLCVNFP